jgi:hypothetical protein
MTASGKERLNSFGDYANLFPDLHGKGDQISQVCRERRAQFGAGILSCCLIALFCLSF